MTNPITITVASEQRNYSITVYPSRRVEIKRDGERLSPDARLDDDALRGGPHLGPRDWEIIEHAVMTAVEAAA